MDDVKQRLAELRAAIDDLDRRILELLNERAGLARRVGEIKREAGARFYAPGREEDLLRRLEQANPGPFPNAAVRAVWREIISASLALEAPMSVAYLGPPATFTHQAALRRFGESARLEPARTIGEVFERVEKGKVAYGVIPVENTTEGVVSHTLDMFLRSELKIVAEVYLRVTHHLLNRSGRLGDVERIYSHPHAVAQCRGWLETHLAEVPVFDAASTAQAAKIASEDPGAAAIAAEVAAQAYGLRVVESRIEDNPNNFTRFLVIGPEIPDPSGRDKTSVVFAVRDEVGALYRMLQPFFEHGVNLTKIESRPMPDEAWQYVFFTDCEGHLTEPGVRAALEELRSRCRFLRVLGSYPQGSLPRAQ
ncbi:prephenate dehydratase [Deferrisoma camini]|uniref:prephenate dehydratase n=1 Tax=Deferrisoma camini TaxID=1035120 RepID=UPI00046D2C29|nr:prephenate dehydratase [Deferrisoma camini]